MLPFHVIPAVTGAVASALARCLSDEELNWLAAFLVQLGDSLALLSAGRARCGQSSCALACSGSTAESSSTQET